MRRIPDRLLSKLLFMSGIIWMLFGMALFLAFLGGLFGRPASNFPNPFPLFGFVEFQINFAVSWIHMAGLILAPLFCIAVGLAICLNSGIRSDSSPP